MGGSCAMAFCSRSRKAASSAAVLSAFSERISLARSAPVSTSSTIWLSIVEPAVTVVPLPFGPCSGETVGTVISHPLLGFTCIESSRNSAAPHITS